MYNHSMACSKEEAIRELRRRLTAAGFDNVESMTDAEVEKLCTDMLKDLYRKLGG